jgi:hypothetical protein
MDSILYNYSDNTDMDIDNITTLLIKDIESFFENDKDDYYELNTHMIFEIDHIQMDITILKDLKKYYYKLYAKNFWYHAPNPSQGNFVCLFQSCKFYTVLELLEHFKDVKMNYTFLDNILCSPKQKEKIIKLKKTLSFFPKDHNDNECSICYEPTKLVTVCNHPICLHCRESCILLQKKNCPICRGTKLYCYPYQHFTL